MQLTGAIFAKHFGPTKTRVPDAKQTGTTRRKSLQWRQKPLTLETWPAFQDFRGGKATDTKKSCTKKACLTQHMQWMRDVPLNMDLFAHRKETGEAKISQNYLQSELVSTAREWLQETCPRRDAAGGAAKANRSRSGGALCKAS